MYGGTATLLQPWDEMSRVGTGGMPWVEEPQRATAKRSENRHLAHHLDFRDQIKPLRNSSILLVTRRHRDCCTIAEHTFRHES